MALTIKYLALLPIALAALLAPHSAQAQSAQATGFSQANVVTPGSIVPLTALRFGQILIPATAGTMAINNAGTVTSTGGVTTAMAITQYGTGRGPGAFELTGSPNRQCDVTLPASITISNGTQTMTVNAFNANVNGGGKIKLDATGHAQLDIGATLNVAANQAVGAYTGSYNITVAFQ
jgi:hypothetical protein